MKEIYLSPEHNLAALLSCLKYKKTHTTATTHTKKENSTTRFSHRRKDRNIIILVRFEMFDSFWNFLKRQYLRYTVVTAVYMLGTTETVIIHSIIFLIMAFVFNYMFSVLNFVNDGYKMLPGIMTNDAFIEAS
jgi:hypothetical protein